MSYIIEPAPEPVKATQTPMKIECLITCVNHADFLAVTLPHNLRYFDRLIVVTDPADKQTRKICDFYRVETTLTAAFNTGWGEFRKGAGINAGLEVLNPQNWFCHMDSDIVMPPHSREALERADLDPTMIYGLDRIEFRSWLDWQTFISDPEPPVQGNGFFIHTSHAHPRRFGTRISFEHAGGYTVIGFWQLWNPKVSGVTKYLEGHNDAGREDSVFAVQWPRRKRGFIPEISVYHLESEPAEMGVNWGGRKTKSFGPASV